MDFPRGIAQIVSIPGGAAGTEATVKYMVQLAVSDAKEPEMVQYARRIVSDVPSKDYEGEARAIFEFVRSNVRYRLDPRGLEWVQRPFVTLLVDGAGDCFAKGTRVLKRTAPGANGGALVPIESLVVGDEIWGWADWTRVERTWDRGIRKTWGVSVAGIPCRFVRLTPEHKVWQGGPGVFLPEVRKPLSEFDPSKDRLVSLLDVNFKGTNSGPNGGPKFSFEAGGVPFDIRKDDLEVPCVDIATTDHFVWLPDAQIVVSNCDDQSMLVACLALCLGHGAAFKTVKVDPDRPEEYSHVYPLIGIRNKSNKPVWLAADTTQKGVDLGWEPPPERVLGSKTWILAEP